MSGIQSSFKSLYFTLQKFRCSNQVLLFVQKVFGQIVLCNCLIFMLVYSYPIKPHFFYSDYLCFIRLSSYKKMLHQGRKSSAFKRIKGVNVIGHDCRCQPVMRDPVFPRPIQYPVHLVTPATQIRKACQYTLSALDTADLTTLFAHEA